VARLSCQSGCLGGATGQGAEPGSSSGYVQLSPKESEVETGRREPLAQPPPPPRPLCSFMSCEDSLGIDADWL
jgi:hypothetical protein